MSAPLCSSASTMALPSHVIESSAALHLSSHDSPLVAKIHRVSGSDDLEVSWMIRSSAVTGPAVVAEAEGQ